MLKRYAISLTAVWTAALLCAVVYARAFAIPAHAATAVVAAALIEVAFYIAPAFGGLRLPPGLLAGSGVVPYLIYAGLSGTFSWSGLLLVSALACAVTFWFIVLPRHAVVDALFLVMMAAVFLAAPFKLAYLPLEEAPKVPVEYLGRLMWIRLGIAAALYLRRAEGIGFGFIPSPRDWKIGFLHYLAFLPAGYVLNLVLGFAQPRTMPPDLARFALVMVATFFGMLWVQVLAEEFFFRGLLQQWLEKWMKSPAAALLCAALLFGAVHLPFRSAFPNWRFALLACVAGLFYGLAFRAAKSIRAAMVTHVLVNITWRVFFV